MCRMRLNVLLRGFKYDVSVRWDDLLSVAWACGLKKRMRLELREEAKSLTEYRMRRYTCTLPGYGAGGLPWYGVTLPGTHPGAGL